MKAPLPFLIALAMAAGPAQAAETIAPGYWESTNQMLSPIHTKSVEKRCLTPADIDKFMMGPSNRHYACTYPTRSFDGGRIALDGVCVSKKGQKVRVRGQGDYSRTTFNLTATVATQIFGIPIAGRVRTEARRLADACPPPTPPASG